MSKNREIFKSQKFNFPNGFCKHRKIYRCLARISCKKMRAHSKICNNQLNRQFIALEFFKKDKKISRLLKKQTNTRKINNILNLLVKFYRDSNNAIKKTNTIIKSFYRKITSIFDLSEHFNENLGKRNTASKNIEQHEYLIKTYGHLLYSSFEKLLVFLNDISSNKFFKKYVGEDKSYELNKSSKFLDLGSGYGLPPLHAYIKTGCKSVGYELIKERVEASNKNKIELKENLACVKNPVVKFNSNLIKFENKNIFKCKTFNPFTHIYMYGVLFFQPHNIDFYAKKLAKILNKSDFKVLIINLSEKKIKKYKIKHLKLIGIHPGIAIGSQQFYFYIYIKIQS